MDQLTPSFCLLLDPFRPCFRVEVFSAFRLMAAAWVVCLGRRTISRVWQTTGRSASHSHCPAYRLFSEAAWNFDDVCRILLVKLLAAFVPGCRVWLVVDDTLCHKRGANVAFGGIFLDAVLSSKRHKVFRFGTNWVTLGLVVRLPFRQDRFFCLNVLWRVCTKKDKAKAQHRTKPQLAREMVELVASWLPGRRPVVVADGAYMGKHLLKGLPPDVAAIGPVHRKAALTEPLPDGYRGRRKKGEPLTTPGGAFADGRWVWQGLLLRHPKGEKRLQVKVIGPCCWYNAAGQRPLLVVLVRDPEGEWRDEALLSSDLGLSAQEVVLGYLGRWSVEVAYCESKQLLGFHDPKVYSERAVQRAHPMAWLVGSLVVLWYAQVGRSEPQAHSHRPWYEDKVSPTFSDMLACSRLHLWSNWLGSEPGRREGKVAWLLEYLATAA
jgi:hypothetical protein